MPVQLQRAMAAEAEAAREARAKVTQKNVSYMTLSLFKQVIAAEGEQRASRALKDAADVISQSSALLQLRYLQVSRNI